MIGFPDIISHKITAPTVFEQLPNIPLRFYSFLEHAFKHLQGKLAKSCAQSKEWLSMLRITDVRILKFSSYESKKVRIILLIWEPWLGKCCCLLILRVRILVWIVGLIFQKIWDINQDLLTRAFNNLLLSLILPFTNNIPSPTHSPTINN